jgi:phosphoglycerate kinase
MISKKTIKDLPDSLYQDKRVLVRTDFNVPLKPDGSVANDLRIRETLPTLQYLVDRGARVILVTHLGRPKGTVDPEYSLKPVVKDLQALMPKMSIKSVSACVGPDVTTAVENLKPGEILVLENIRFEPGETQNDATLSNQLAQLADIYVNDAFGTSHRAHASTEGVTHFVPICVAGLLMEKELHALEILLKYPEKPFTAIVGGSKVSTKIGVLKELMTHVNNLVIGGGMVFTFLKAKGYNVGSSLVEDDFLIMATEIMEQAEATDKIIILPKDIVVADRFAADASHQVVSLEHIPEAWMGLDIGPESTSRIMDVLRNSKTVFWNGPLGVFEFPPFAKSTEAIAREIADQTQKDHLVSILGGGDTLAAIEQFGIAPSAYTHVSTGGGATMELIEGKTLPGVSALDDRVPSGIV